MDESDKLAGCPPYHTSQPALERTPALLLLPVVTRCAVAYALGPVRGDEPCSMAVSAAADIVASGAGRAVHRS